jgi:hypothetical protein
MLGPARGVKFYGLKIGAFTSNLREFGANYICIFGTGISFCLSPIFPGFSAFTGENSIFGAIDGTNVLALRFKIGLASKSVVFTF